MKIRLGGLPSFRRWSSFRWLNICPLLLGAGCDMGSSADTVERTDTSSAGSTAIPSAGAGSSVSSAGTSPGVPSGGAGTANANAGGGSTGGVSGTSGGAGSGPSADAFTLAWQDDFDAIDASKWELADFTWEGNQAQFTPENATVADGILKISLTTAPEGAAKPYRGVEMRSRQTITYGKVSARMRFAPGSGVVSGLVLFYTPYPNCDWNEIDIEHLGKSSGTSQLNAMVYTGSPQPGCSKSVTPTQDPLVVDLGFDAESDFHVYDIEWTPAGVSYFGDGRLLRTWTKNITLLALPQNVLLTIWASASAGWAGPLTDTSAPASAELDWIKVYDFTG